jgi:hypothetical protein
VDGVTVKALDTSVQPDSIYQEYLNISLGVAQTLKEPILLLGSEC